MSTYKTAPPLIPSIKQWSHSELLTPIQIEEAKKMGIINLTIKNTQFDLLKALRSNSKTIRARHTSKYVKNLVHKRGRKVAKVILNNAFEKFGHL